MKANKDKSTTWIVVGHRAGVQIFSTKGPAAELECHKSWEHPEGRLRAGDLMEDRTGIVFDRAGPGQRKMEPTQEPTDLVVHGFANDIAGYLEHARHERRFDRLVLVAGPKFLGMLRGALTDATRATVVGSVNKNLQDAKAGDVQPHVAELLG